PSPAGHLETGWLPSAMFTIVTSSSMVTWPLPSQSPRHVPGGTVGVMGVAVVVGVGPVGVGPVGVDVAIPVAVAVTMAVAVAVAGVALGVVGDTIDVSVGVGVSAAMTA